MTDIATILIPSHLNSGDFDDTILVSHTGLVGLLLGCSVFLAVVYLINSFCIAGGVPKSISAHVYRLRLSQRWYYTAWVWMVSLTFAPSLFLLTPHAFDSMPHLLVTSLLLTAVLPLIEREGQTWHMVSSVVSVAACAVCVYIVSYMWLLVWIPVLVWCVMYHNHVAFFGQMASIVSLFGSLITRMTAI